MSQNMNSNDFHDWGNVITRIAVKTKPTRHGENTAHEFMLEVERIFKLNGWDLNEFIEAATTNHMHRVHEQMINRGTAAKELEESA